MKCPKCQFENREGVNFCESCGDKLELVCPQCGATVPLDRNFCGKCGLDLIQSTEPPPIDYSQPQSYTPKFLADKILTTRSSIEGERKLVTVLFADVENYTSISEKLDPEEVHGIMDGCFKILMNEIHRYEGTINQFTGDGVMALFGAPVAHEDHGQRACHAALSIQKAIGGFGERLQTDRQIQFKMRIGLNSGPVIVGTIGDDLKMEYTAVGDTVNLASRMETMAQSGSVLVSGHTHRLVRDFFGFEPLGKIPVKGKEEPQQAYELIGPSEVETRIAASAAKGLTKFVGRKNEMEVLREAFDRARTGSGQVVGIVGEAGVGKSRLIMEFRNTLGPIYCTCLEGRCLHYGGTMAYLPVLDTVKSYLDIQEDDKEYVIKKKVKEGLNRLDEYLLGSLPSLYELLSLEVEDAQYLQIDPRQRKMMTFEAIRDLLIRESQTKPLILAVEDLHWIDKTSQEFLDYLVEWLPNAHILVILLYRPEYRHTWVSKSYYAQIGLAQLSTESSARLVETILEEGDVVPELRELILSKAGGNPLFVEEVTRSLVENGSIQRKTDQYVLTRKAAEIEVPDTIQGIIASRVDRVEENLKRIMQVASVIGRKFAYRILRAIMGMREELKSQLLDLQGLEFIHEKQLFPELEYIFKHALTQEVAYNSLLLRRRKEIHEKIGQTIEELYSDRLEEYYELLAYHYLRGENEDKAVQYLDLSNRKAMKASSVEEAKAYFDQAMELLDTLPETEKTRGQRLSMLVNQGTMFELLFKTPEYYELLTRYESQATKMDNPGLMGAFYSELGFCENTFGSVEQSIQTETKAVELCEGAGDASNAAYAYRRLAWSHVMLGEGQKALSFTAKALNAMGKDFDLRTYTFTHIAACAAYGILGRWDASVEEGKKALAAGQEYSDKIATSLAAFHLAIPYANKGDLRRAVEYGELAVQMALTPLDKAQAQGSLAWIWCRSGEPTKGIEVLAPLVQIAPDSGSVPVLIMCTQALGEGYYLAGEYGKARQTLQGLLDLSQRCGAKYHGGVAYRLLGEIALVTDPAEAPPHFEKAISICQETKAENDLALAYSGMGRYHKQQGNTEQAREYLTKALEIFERLGTLIEPDKVKEELEGLVV